MKNMGIINNEQLEHKRAYHRNYVKTHRVACREYYKKWYKKWYEKNKLGENYPQFLRKEALRTRKYQLGLKVKVFNILGNKCARCGIDDIRVLQIDHINGGGLKDIRGRSWTVRYREILRTGKGKNQLLCANCNWIKRSENDETCRKYIYKV